MNHISLVMNASGALYEIVSANELETIDWVFECIRLVGVLLGLYSFAHTLCVRRLWGITTARLGVVIFVYFAGSALIASVICSAIFCWTSTGVALGQKIAARSTVLMWLFELTFDASLIGILMCFLLCWRMARDSRKSSDAARAV